METTISKLSRRNFIKLSGMTGAALTLGLYTEVKGEEAKIIKPDVAKSLGTELNAWISIDTSGKVTIMNHRAEMGQGAYQSVPQMIAEELEVDLNKVDIVFGVGNEKKYGSQITGGSSTVRSAYKHLCRMGATAREMLIEAAAKKWNVDNNTCYAENGNVIHKPSGRKFHYGELVEEASKIEPRQTVALKKVEDYKILRKPVPRQDTPLKTNGSAIFGIDKKLPGMLYAVIERNPRFIGKVKSFDDTAAKKIPGVKHVFTVKVDVFSSVREGVAVVADTFWNALQGRKALKVEWDDTGFAHHSTEELYAKMNEELRTKEGISYRTKGNVSSALSKATKKVEAVYETPYQSHSCMEPLNCVAHVKEDAAEIWGPIQAPGWIQDDLAKVLGLPKEKITVNMTFLGGGFGRKAFFDYTQEAALISREIKAPVQVMWTREDDTIQGPFRPGMVYQCAAGLSEGGRINSYKFKMAGQNMDHQWPGASKDSYNGSTTEGFLEAYFNSIPHFSFADLPLDSPVPVMWWRSVYSSTNGFAYESFMDELALEAGKDPLEFRREHVGEERYQLLIGKLEEVSGWKSRKKNEGFGVAITECFSSIVGEVVKVSKDANGKVKIDKVWAVMDCGWYVNPDIIKAQVEGSIIMALGAATKHATHFKDGKAVERNFDSYKMVRISETPEIEVHIMDNDEKAGGVGEPGLPPFTPALTNAIFDLTGKRIRTLPFNLEEV
ncbi:molybdopterin cofactor-binding domain-containing protein [Chryseolinea sp. H1M3-3]|uniref:molybdopterin cofactor-binding domain-containing protein n=1 Tax=Chryseolinea sp. H1M3-3 TaxID=3034144 RepID=UPI0023EBB609|nr:molybdopterin cofactor-binding domain-containing protein [Chryseolinea sp. H1M3-3]